MVYHFDITCIQKGKKHLHHVYTVPQKKHDWTFLWRLTALQILLVSQVAAPGGI